MEIWRSEFFVYVFFRHLYFKRLSDHIICENIAKDSIALF